jgi:hypothetical protein
MSTPQDEDGDSSDQAEHEEDRQGDAHAAGVTAGKLVDAGTESRIAVAGLRRIATANLGA